MSHPVPSFMVNVDVTNPGQFFACCGLLELAKRQLQDEVIEGWFTDKAFCVAVAGSASDVFNRLLETMLNAQAVEVGESDDRATRQVHLKEFDITLGWWLPDRGKKTRLKLWAGNQTSLGIVNELKGALGEFRHVAVESLFDAGKPLTGRFGVDPRAAWNALDVGFSPNEQEMEVITYPAVELLAAIGLQRFRPVQEEHESSVSFGYATWSIPLQPPVACAASVGLLPSGKVKTYRFRIGKRGSYKNFDYAIQIGGEK